MQKTNQTEFFQKYRDENDAFIKDYDKRMERLTKNQLTKTQTFTMRLFVLLFFLGLSAATIGTVYFSNFTRQSEPVVLTITSDEKVKSGDTLSYDVIVSNRGTVPLTGLSLIVEYPLGFQYESSNSEAANADHTYWTLENIPRGSSKTISIRGIVSGAPSQEKTIQVSLHYRIGDSDTEFVAKRQGTARISEPLISIQVSGPQLAQTEKEISYGIIYGDLSAGLQQEALAIKVKAPKEFLFSAVPAMDIPNGWSDQLIRKGFDTAKRSGELSLKGMFSKDAKGDYEFIVQIGKTIHNQFIVADEKKHSVHIAKNPLSLKLAINNSETFVPMNSIERIRAKIYYENTTLDELSDVAISLGGNTELIDWSESENPLYGTLKDSKITWTKKEISSLDRMRPAQKGEISIDFGLKDEIVFRKYIEDHKLAGKPLSLDLTLTASMYVAHNNEEQQLIQEPLTASIPLQSDTQVISSLKHIEGNRYSVEWTIQNTFHQIENIHVTAALGNNTTWFGNETRSAGDIVYDQEKRKVQWTLNRMPLSIKSIQASFEVLFDQQDANEIVVNEGFFEATDSVAKGTISLPMAKGVRTIE